MPLGSCTGGKVILYKSQSGTLWLIRIGRFRDGESKQRCCRGVVSVSTTTRSRTTTTHHSLSLVPAHPPLNCDDAA